MVLSFFIIIFTLPFGGRLDSQNHGLEMGDSFFEFMVICWYLNLSILFRLTMFL